MTALVVADSSYIVEGLLKDSSLFDDDICSPDYGLYEVLNAVWKHEVLLRRIKESRTIVETLFELVAAGRIRFMAMEGTVKKAYELAVRTKSTIYDSVFVVLASELGTELRTLDKKQAEVFKSHQH